MIVLASLLLIPSRGTWGDSGAGVGTTLFARGQTRLSATVGYGSVNSKDYGVLGLGAGYFLADGLETGIDGEAWVGSKPHIYTLSPEVRYVVTDMEYKPYVGGFFKRTFYDTLTNLNSAGARAGLLTPVGSRSYLTFGLVYEKFFNCDSTLYGSCSQTYPEISFSFAY